MYKSGDIHTHTRGNNKLCFGPVEKTQPRLHAGIHVCLKKFGLLQDGCQSLNTTDITVTLTSQFDVQQPRTTGMQNISEKNNSQGAHMHTAILTPKTWPRHPRRKSTCLKRCSKEPEKKTQGPQQTAALTQQVGWHNQKITKPQGTSTQTHARSHLE